MPTVGSSFGSAWGMLSDSKLKLDISPRQCPERHYYGTVYHQSDGYWKCALCGKSWLECPTESKA